MIFSRLFEPLLSSVDQCFKWALWRHCFQSRTLDVHSGHCSCIECIEWLCGCRQEQATRCWTFDAVAVTVVSEWCHCHHAPDGTSTAKSFKSLTLPTSKLSPRRPVPTSCCRVAIASALLLYVANNIIIIIRFVKRQNVKRLPWH